MIVNAFNLLAVWKNLPLGTQSYVPLAVLAVTGLFTEQVIRLADLHGGFKRMSRVTGFVI